MRRIAISAVLPFLLILLFLIPARAGTPPPARTILNAALKDASASGKSVFLIFHATWCSWCKRLDAALDKPEVRKIVEHYYVITHLDVLERGDKKQTVENPGGEEIMKSLGGERSGLPFYVVLDSTGKKLVDSNIMPENSNIGFPGSQEEIAAFEKILKQTAPRMTAEERAKVVSHLGVKQ